jgi:hypothetical protein
MPPKIRTNVSSTFFIVFDCSENPPAEQAAGRITTERMYHHRYWKSSIVTFSAVASVPFKFNEYFFPSNVPEKLICLPPEAA